MVDKMPPLPATSARVAQIANDGKSTIADMDQVISTDPVLSTKLLKLVNSAYYGLPQKITTTSRAIGHLGMNNVKNIVLAEVVMKTMRESVVDQNPHKEKIMREFWHHSVGCSIATKMIAKKAGFSAREVEELALAALVHDLGAIVLFNFMPDKFVETIEYSMSNKVSLLKAEHVVYDSDVVTVFKPREEGSGPTFLSVDKPVDHTYVGHELAKKWELPKIMECVIHYHHQPWDCPDPLYSRAVNLIYLADCFCKMHDSGFGGDSLDGNFDTKILDQLDVDINYLELMREKWQAEVDEIEDAFDVLRK